MTSHYTSVEIKGISINYIITYVREIGNEYSMYVLYSQYHLVYVPYCHSKGIVVYIYIYIYVCLQWLNFVRSFIILSLIRNESHTIEIRLTRYRAMIHAALRSGDSHRMNHYRRHFR